MKLFDVYPLYSVTIDYARDCYLWDTRGRRYLDFYGGHAVISVGHSHPHYIKRLTEQLHKIGYYSNVVRIEAQHRYLELLSEFSGYPDYQFFFCNSGAEAVENALKLASFHTGRDKVLAFKKAFHGRTSGAVAVTDNAKIRSSFNAHHKVTFTDLNDMESAQKYLNTREFAAVILEGIQGQVGVYPPDPVFLKSLRTECSRTGTMLILDEIQSGYGRTGHFFAHQAAGIQADLITVAKGMGNGFPVAGVLIHPQIEASAGLLGTTFGGNPLAATAALAVLEIYKEEGLLDKATRQGEFLIQECKKFPFVKEVRGKGLMVGLELEQEVKKFRKFLIEEKQLFVGAAGNPNTIRLLPPLTTKKQHVEEFLETFESAYREYFT